MMKFLFLMPCNSIRIKWGLLLLFFCAVFSCSPNKNEESKEVPETPIETDVSYEVLEEKSLSAYYNIDHIKEWYPERILPPPIDYEMNLSGYSIVELWLLRNEIFARNGYLFDDAVLRGYFNQFKWYQPIFDVPEFKVQLNKDEQDFVSRVLKRENELIKDRYLKSGKYEMINVEQVLNQIQFEEIPRELMKALSEKNFAIVPAKHEQFFHVYDRNHYEYIPNFITTDIYLQVLHKHFSSILRRVEEEKFIPLLTELLKGAHQRSLEFEKTVNDETLKKASQWTTVYLAIGYSLITNNYKQVAPEMEAIYKEEIGKIMKSESTGSDFLKSVQIQYSQFKPRGNYTKSKELENYFRCIKWLNTAPIYIDEDERLLSVLLIGSIIKQSPQMRQSFKTFNEALTFIVGEEDNLSISTILDLLPDSEAGNPALLNNPEKLKPLRGKLKSLNVDKIRPVAGNETAEEEFSRASVLFTAGRYTFDAEILSKIVHVLRPEPKRPFPKGLDVFAALGNKTAENILISEYKEGEQWPEYPTSLNKLKNQFSTFNDWNKNLYTKTFEMIGSIHMTNSDYPLFMNTSFWEKKNLVTTLAAWAELKHDMLLYSEQPYAAQAGEGGGPPPPQHISYVEPNISFWKKSVELLDHQEQKLLKMGLMTDEIKSINDELRRLSNLFLRISEKQLTGKDVTPEEFDELSWIGGRIEQITFRIFDTDHLPQQERHVALVADVYNYNGAYLEEATGMVDEIYVVAEINGKPYLTKGAVFSYYEFTSGEPLSDEQWHQQLISESKPKRPIWTNEITVNSKSLESKPTYSF